MPEVEIRPAVATDMPQLSAIEHSIMSDYVWQLDVQKDGNHIAIFFREVRLPRSVIVQYPHSPSDLADEWTEDKGFLVAVTGGMPVGYIRLNDRVANSVAWIKGLAVERNQRRKGIASALLLSAHGWAVSRNCQRTIIEMSSKNFPAISLALKLGYEFCGYNDQYYKTKDVTLFFSRTLK